MLSPSFHLPPFCCSMMRFADDDDDDVSTLCFDKESRRDALYACFDLCLSFYWKTYVLIMTLPIQLALLVA